MPYIAECDLSILLSNKEAEALVEVLIDWANGPYAIARGNCECKKCQSTMQAAVTLREVFEAFGVDSYMTDGNNISNGVI